jgi:hypothetical protein
MVPAALATNESRNGVPKHEVGFYIKAHGGIMKISEEEESDEKKHT